MVPFGEKSIYGYLDGVKAREGHSELLNILDDSSFGFGVSSFEKR
jgi:hypothetical protein